MEGRRSRRRHDRRPAGARIGAHRLPAFLQGPHRPRRLPAGDLSPAARVRAAYAVDLQRPRIHAARVHPGGRPAAEPGFTGAPGARIRTPARRAIPTACQLSSRPSHWHSTRRAAGAIAPRRRRWIPGAGGCSSAKSTTRTPGRSAAPRVMPACSERSPRSAHSRARCWPRSPVSQSWPGPIRMRRFIQPSEFPAARARSDGTRCCRRRRAARACLRRRSATPASPARRSGSTGSATSTLSC